MRHKAYYFALIVVLLVSYFVLGPLVQRTLVDKHRPYIIVNPSEVSAAEAQGDKMCSLPPVPTVEMIGMDPEDGEVVYLSYLPPENDPVYEYIHYPEDWDKWWNLYNHEHLFTRVVIKGMYVVLYLCLAGLIGYNVYLWRTGRLKEMLRRFKP